MVAVTGALVCCDLYGLSVKYMKATIGRISNRRHPKMLAQGALFMFTLDSAVFSDSGSWVMSISILWPVKQVKDKLNI